MALKFGVSESWVRRIKQERREQGKTAPATTRRRTPQWQSIAEQLRTTVARHPDLTLAELKQVLGTQLSVATLCRALRAMKLTIKKKS